MSVGNLKTEGNKGNNFPFQLNTLEGLQCACDQLKLIEGNTDQVEGLLASILSSLQNGQDYEAAIVEDANGVIWLEIRIYDPATSSFLPPNYYLAGSLIPGTPVAPLTYISPSSLLAQIVANTTGIALETSLVQVVGNTSAIASVVTNTNPNSRQAGYQREIGTTVSSVQVYSIAFANVGTADAFINGQPLKSGESINFDAGGLNNFFVAGTFNYDTTIVGAELIVTFIF